MLCHDMFYMGTRALEPDTRFLFEATVPQSRIPNIYMLMGFARQRCSILENTRDPIVKKVKDTVKTRR